MDRVLIDLSAVADIDPLQIGRPATLLPYRRPTFGSETALEAALGAYCAKSSAKARSARCGGALPWCGR